MSQETETTDHLDALVAAGLVDHVLEITLNPAAAEGEILDLLQEIVEGPLFRLARSHYAFRLPEDHVEALSEALGDVDGTLRAIERPEGDAPLAAPARDLLAALATAESDAAEAVRAHAGLSAAFAIEAARLTAQGLVRVEGEEADDVTPQPDVDALAQRIDQLAEKIEASLEGDAPAPVLDIGAIADLLAEHMPATPLASGEQVADVARQLSELERRLLSALPSGEKVYQILRQRLERLQSTSDMLLDRLVEADPASKESADLTPTLAALDAALAELPDALATRLGEETAPDALRAALSAELETITAARDAVVPADAPLRMVLAALRSLEARIQSPERSAINPRLASLEERAAAAESSGAALLQALDALKSQANDTDGFADLRASIGAVADDIRALGAAQSALGETLLEAAEAARPNAPDLAPILARLQESDARSADAQEALETKLDSVHQGTAPLLARLDEIGAALGEKTTGDDALNALGLRLETRLNGLSEAVSSAANPASILASLQSLAEAVDARASDVKAALNEAGAAGEIGDALTTLQKEVAAAKAAQEGLHSDIAALKEAFGPTDGTLFRDVITGALSAQSDALATIAAALGKVEGQAPKAEDLTALRTSVDRMETQQRARESALRSVVEAVPATVTESLGRSLAELRGEEAVTLEAFRGALDAALASGAVTADELNTAIDGLAGRIETRLQDTLGTSLLDLRGGDETLTDLRQAIEKRGEGDLKGSISSALSEVFAPDGDVLTSLKEALGLGGTGDSWKEGLLTRVGDLLSAELSDLRGADNQSLSDLQGAIASAGAALAGKEEALSAVEERFRRVETVTTELLTLLVSLRGGDDASVEATQSAVSHLQATIETGLSELSQRLQISVKSQEGPIDGTADEKNETTLASSIERIEGAQSAAIAQLNDIATQLSANGALANALQELVARPAYSPSVTTEIASRLDAVHQRLATIEPVAQTSERLEKLASAFEAVLADSQSLTGTPSGASDDDLSKRLEALSTSASTLLERTAPFEAIAHRLQSIPDDMKAQFAALKGHEPHGQLDRVLERLSAMTEFFGGQRGADADALSEAVDTALRRLRDQDRDRQDTVREACFRLLSDLGSFRGETKLALEELSKAGRPSRDAVDTRLDGLSRQIEPIAETCDELLAHTVEALAPLASLSDKVASAQADGQAWQASVLDRLAALRGEGRRNGDLLERLLTKPTKDNDGAFGLDVAIKAAIDPVVDRLQRLETATADLGPKLQDVANAVADLRATEQNTSVVSALNSLRDEISSQEIPSSSENLARLQASIDLLTHREGVSLEAERQGIGRLSVAMQGVLRRFDTQVSRIERNPDGDSLQGIEHRLDAIEARLSNQANSRSPVTLPPEEREGLSRLSSALQHVLRRFDQQVVALEERSHALSSAAKPDTELKYDLRMMLAEFLAQAQKDVAPSSVSQSKSA
ncbi:MAG: hypothetical protein AAGA32_04560 [Pseudomonadota bacterium]